MKNKMKVNRIKLIKKDEKSWATDILSTRRIWQQILKKSIDDLKKVALYFSELNYNSIKHYHLHQNDFEAMKKNIEKEKMENIKLREKIEELLK